MTGRWMCSRSLVAGVSSPRGGASASCLPTTWPVAHRGVERPALDVDHTAAALGVPEAAEAPAMLSIGSHGANGNVTGILDLQAHEAIADLDADAYRRARSQLRVPHAVGHELGDEQLRITEHLVGDLGGEPCGHRGSRRRRGVESGRDDDLHASHIAGGHGAQRVKRCPGTPPKPSMKGARKTEMVST